MGGGPSATHSLKKGFCYVKKGRRLGLTARPPPQYLDP